MTTYKVSDKGPIDRYPPGADVSDIYDAETLTRLIDDGYVIEEKPKPKPRRKAKAKAIEGGE